VLVKQTRLLLHFIRAAGRSIAAEKSKFSP